MASELARSNELAFFEVAATLIPLLLFGGIALERLRPPDNERLTRTHVAVAFNLPAFGSLLIFAEIVAITALISGDPGTFQTVMVAIALVVGMVAVLAAVSWPWLRRLKQDEPRQFRRARVLNVIIVAAVAIASVYFLTTWVDLADRSDDLAADIRKSSRAARALNSVAAEHEDTERRLVSLRLRAAALSPESPRFRALKLQAAIEFRALRRMGRQLDRQLLASINADRALADRPPLKRLPRFARSALDRTRDRLGSLRQFGSRP